jgi:hypothetical protein
VGSGTRRSRRDTGLRREVGAGPEFAGRIYPFAPGNPGTRPEPVRHLRRRVLAPVTRPSGRGPPGLRLPGFVRARGQKADRLAPAGRMEICTSRPRTSRFLVLGSGSCRGPRSRSTRCARSRSSSARRAELFLVLGATASRAFPRGGAGAPSSSADRRAAGDPEPAFQRSRRARPGGQEGARGAPRAPAGRSLLDGPAREAPRAREPEPRSHASVIAYTSGPRPLRDGA